MKIQAFLFIAALLLFTAFVQDTDGALGFAKPGRRELKRKVCTVSTKESKKTRLALYLIHKLSRS